MAQITVQEPFDGAEVVRELRALHSRSLRSREEIERFPAKLEEAR